VDTLEALAEVLENALSLENLKASETALTRARMVLGAQVKELKIAGAHAKEMVAILTAEVSRVRVRVRVRVRPVLLQRSLGSGKSLLVWKRYTTWSDAISDRLTLMV